MSQVGRDHFHRTAKILADSGRASDIADARRQLERLVLQVAVGKGIQKDLAAQAALFTAINAGKRAMLGGVRVIIEDDPQLSLPWVRGDTLSEAVSSFGGVVADRYHDDAPILTVGQSLARPDDHRRVRLAACWRGWCGGVTDAPDKHVSGEAVPLAGVVAGALGVSEIFQHLLGSPVAGRRTVGLSLWQPDVHWQALEAEGPTLQYVPTGVWLLGLGHLGQANAWSLGSLPYESPEELEAYLVDFDPIVEANHATGLLTELIDVGKYKTRVVASRLESLGYRTRLIERRFDDQLIPQATEPSQALAGFDSPEPRRLLGDKFARVVDAGLGSGSTGYLDMIVHTFPSQLCPEEEFASGQRIERPLTVPYEAEITRRISQGIEPGDARCGVVQLAGATAAAAFVGATAGALGIADLLRCLHGGPDYAVVGVDLRNPSDARVARSAIGDGPVNPGFTSVRYGTS